MTVPAEPRVPWLAIGRRRESGAAAAIAGFALLSYAWNIGSAGYGTYYSAGARSMTMSWRAFWFGAFDPGANVTLDKLSGFLVPQALSARLFGFHPWSLALPQVIEGVITVLAIYVIGRRWRGPAVGLLAAGIAAITPVFASMFGHVMEDGLLTMSLALSTLCWQSSLLRFRIRSLVLAGSWVGVGFQAKMMQAWVLLPGLFLGLLVLAGVSRRRQLRAILALAATTLTTSLLWMTVIQLIPASRRPVIDGTSNNNIYSMVFGYNGFNRVLPHLVAGVLSGNRGKGHVPVLSIVRRTRRLPAAMIPSGLEHNKLVLPYYASQIGWLYPAAVVGLAVELGLVLRLWRQRAERVEAVSSDGAAEATTLALTIWLVLAAGLLTVTRVPHVAYLATIGVQLALLAAAGLVALVRRYPTATGPATIALPALVLVSGAWACFLLWDGHAAPAGLGWLVLAGTGFAGVILLLGRIEPRVRRAAVAIGVIAVLLPSASWTGYVFDRATGGTANEAYAGPRPGGRHLSYQISRPFAPGPDLGPTLSQRHLLTYLSEQHARSSTVLTDNWTIAASYLLATRLQVLSMGGFSGRAPTPQLARLEQLIEAGRIRFALLTHGYPTHGVAASLVGANDLWVRSHCTRLSGFDLTDTDVVPQRAVDLYRCG